MSTSGNRYEITDGVPLQKNMGTTPSAMNHGCKTEPHAKSRSTFAAIIAETYFIPGITGRARCLQDHDPPGMATTSFRGCGVKTSLPPTVCVSEHYPAPNPSTWEIEGQFQDSLNHKGKAMIVWAETPRFLRQGTENQNKDTRTQNASTSTERTAASDSLSHSDDTKQKVLSRTMRNDDSSEGTSSSSGSKANSSSASFASLRERWWENQQNPIGSKRTSLLHEELESIQFLLSKQRVRLDSHASLQVNGLASEALSTRPAGPIRAASSRSCRQHEKKLRVRLTSHSSLGPIPEIAGIRPTLRQYEAGRQRRAADDRHATDRPPLVVSIKVPRRIRTTRAPSA